MREALAFLSLIVLISLGWNQSYLEHYAQMTGQAVMKTANGKVYSLGVAGPEAPPMTTTPSTSNSSWMWEKTPLDGAYDRRDVRGR
jgi:hypothetical protein